MSTPFKHLSDRLELLHRQALNGLLHYRMWRRIGDRLRGSEVLRKSFPFFFQMTWAAHIDSATLCVNRIYDKHGNAVRLEEILQFAKRHADAFQNASAGDVERLVSRSRGRLDEIQGKLNSLRGQRNNRFVHLEKEYLGRYDEVFSEHPLEYRDIYDLLRLAADILNDLRGALEDGEMVMEMTEEDQTTRLMDLVEQTIEEHERELRREVERRRDRD